MDFDDLIDADETATVPVAAGVELVPAGPTSAPEVVASDLFVDPGNVEFTSLFMSQPDPLLMAHMFRFTCFAFEAGGEHLVDLDGDGLPDHTCWGTPVKPVSDYIRADGTHVSGHYRTVPDGQAWNNLSNQPD